MGDNIKILYDEGGFNMPYGGVARYFTEMIRRLPEDIAWQLGMLNTRNLYLQKPPYNLPPPEHDVHNFIRNTLKGCSFRGVSHLYRMLAQVMPNRFPSSKLANERFLSQSFNKSDFDIFHFTKAHPDTDVWNPLVGRKPIVVTVFDLIPEIFHINKKVNRFRRKLLKDAAHIITISEWTKRDLVRLYDVPKEKISVIYLGFLKQDGEIRIQSPVVPPYLLYVGNRGGYKNFSFFVKAIAPLLKTTDLTLFCTGMPFDFVEVSLLDRLGIADKVMCCFVEDEEMSSLFRGALAFVYPSLYEGFGIPILDAFSAGCPVILSNCSCFPEIAGDAALYFNEGDADMLCFHILNLMKDGALRENMLEKGFERVQMFTWENCAERTAEVYRRVHRGDLGFNRVA